MLKILSITKLIAITLLVHISGTLALAETAQDLNNKGVGYLNAGEYGKASVYLEQAYALDQENDIIKKNLVNAYAHLAYQYGEKSDWLSAINYGEKAQQLDPDNTQVAKNLAVGYNNYGFALMQQKNFADAYDNFDKAIDLDKDNWSVYVNLGNLMYQQGKTEEAVKYWKKALELQPNLPEIKSKMSSLDKENKIGENFNRQGFAHFEVKYEGSERQDLATKVLYILNDAYYRIGSAFNFYPTEKVTVIIYTQSQYGEVTGNPDWLPGQAEGNGIIRLTIDDIETSEERLKDALYHEYTHILLYRKIGFKISRWFDEGLAQYQEPSGGSKLTKEESALLKKHLGYGDLILLADMDNVWNNSYDRERVSLAYAEAKSVILYLVDRFTMYQVTVMIDKYKSSKDINQAIKETFQLDQAQFEQSWLAWLKGNIK